MQRIAKTVACLAVGAAASLNNENPLGKVIQLLDGLAAKVTREGQEADKAFKEYMAWCDDTSKNKGFDIQTGVAKKDKLEATISKAAKDSEGAAASIEDLAASLAADSADLESATAIRKKEAAEFKAGEEELVDTVETLTRAINTIERAMAKNPAAFAQVNVKNMGALTKSLGAIVDAASLSSADKSKLMSLVQSHQDAESDDDELGAPQASAYKSHSTNIVDVLEDLKEKAEEQLATLRKAETNAKHNYQMLKQSLDDQMRADNKDMDERKADRAAAEELKAQSEGDLTETEKGLADDRKALETCKSTCMQTAADQDASVKARAEELAAIAKAKEILTSSTSGAAEQTYSMLQVDSVSSSGSVSGESVWTRADLAGAEVVNLVKRLAREQHSEALAQLASRISAVMRFGAASGEDPFAKVRQMIEELLNRLESEAGSDASEKKYCDEQMAKTDEKKSDLQGQQDRLTVKIDKAAAASANLKEDVKEAQAQLAKLAKEQAEMDKIRREQNSAYVKAKAELEQGLDGVRKALSVLREYYGSAAAAAMLQNDDNLDAAMRQPAMPEFHSKAGGAGTGIIGMLEVVEADFAKNLAVEETQEADAAAEYEKMSQENRITKSTKEQDVKYETKEFKALDRQVAELNQDRQSVNTELSAVLEYDAKIKERCVAKPETYESRRARREAEIAGLKEALNILENETVFAQRERRGGARLAFLAK